VLSLPLSLARNRDRQGLYRFIQRIASFNTNINNKFYKLISCLLQDRVPSIPEDATGETRSR